MSEETYQKIFSKNLNYYMELNGKNQTDLINDLGFNKSAVSTWCNGTRLPRMDKVEILARYFNINRSDLIEEKEPETGYYLNEETVATAQKIFEEDKILFDVYRSSDKERLVEYAKRLKALRDMEEGNL